MAVRYWELLWDILSLLDITETCIVNYTTKLIGSNRWVMVIVRWLIICLHEIRGYREHMMYCPAAITFAWRRHDMKTLSRITGPYWWKSAVLINIIMSWNLFSRFLPWYLPSVFSLFALLLFLSCFLYLSCYFCPIILQPSLYRSHSDRVCYHIYILV